MEPSRLVPLLLARVGFMVLGLLLVPAAGLVAPANAADEECDPDPIGRCGAFQREAVLLCYKSPLPGGLYVSATETNVIVLGTSPVTSLLGVPPPQPVPHSFEYVGYVWKTPLENFARDPTSAPFPDKVLWKEDNNVKGLQMTLVRCGTWIWFEECYPSSWLGPVNVFSARADKLLA